MVFIARYVRQSAPFPAHVADDGKISWSPPLLDFGSLSAPDGEERSKQTVYREPWSLPRSNSAYSTEPSVHGHRCHRFMRAVVCSRDDELFVYQRVLSPCSDLPANQREASPKDWKRHLDGSAMLLEAAGINGVVGGMRQALFWCFARMGA